MPRNPTGTAKLEKILGVKFKNTALLEEALTHKSYAMEQGRRMPFNERPGNFWATASFPRRSLIISLNAIPTVDDGRLSQLKSMLVSPGRASPFGGVISDVGKYLRLSEGENATGGRDRDSDRRQCDGSASGGAMYLAKRVFELHQKNSSISS